MTGSCASLLLVVIALTSGQVRAQDSSEIITVTGLYNNNPGVEYENVLHPCHIFAVWDVMPTGTAFSTRYQTYAGVDITQLSESGGLFVEFRGRYTAYEEKVHTDGFFEITEFVRHSTVAADIAACEWTCERIYGGVNAPTCLARVDGQCGSTRNSCVTGDLFDDDVSPRTTDTATHYRWVCTGSYGGDNVECTAPKAGLHEVETDERK